ncbi:Hypothetical predicted protein, partial [Pelobates cultripes]
MLSRITRTEDPAAAAAGWEMSVQSSGPLFTAHLKLCHQTTRTTRRGGREGQ